MSRNTPTRTEETRETNTREEDLWKGKDWVEARSLDTPPAPPGLVYRWIREEVNGTYDARNMSVRKREGWVPVEQSELAEGYTNRFGGLILMKIAERIVKQRNAHYRRVSRNQMEGVEQQMYENAQAHPQMPIYNMHRTSVQRGGPRPDIDLDD
ncbi:MAG: hypothetical protein NXI16_01280 [Alphaproteobacteria bacterium]|nr:hypothetical protein [Alphaproteobacteria bacterium]